MKPPRIHTVLVLTAAGSLFVAIVAGLARMGWGVGLSPALAMAHGPLMIGGFLGTLIGLERAVALDRKWAYSAPLLAAAGAVWTVAAGAVAIAAGLFLMSSVALIAVVARVMQSQPALHNGIMAAGAAAWLGGNVLWFLGHPMFEIAWWWMGFLILTIAGERLELTRIMPRSRSVAVLFALIVAIFVVALFLLIADLALGSRLAGISLLALALWLMRNDIARRTIRMEGLTRYMAIALFAGYFWLGFGGLMAAGHGAVYAGPPFDALIHAVFVGFVFSMIFAHAPVILPSVLDKEIRYSPAFYVPLAILHLSLLARTGANMAGALELRLITGMVNGFAILLFAALMIRSMRVRQAESPLLTADAWRRGFRWVWTAALGCFILAGLAGVLFRYGMLNGFPHGLLPENVRHAHSHLMYFSWVTPAVMALIVAVLPQVTGRMYPQKNLRELNVTIASTFVLGLLAFVPFLLYGYTVAEFGDRRIPISMIMAGFNVIPWYFFAGQYRRLTRGLERTPVLHLFDLSIVFLVLSSLGAWSIAVFRIVGFSDVFWDRATIHIFLDMFSDGWLILALLGIAYHVLGIADGKRVRLATWLLAGGLPVAFVLTMPVAIVPPGIRMAASLGAVLMGAGLALHVFTLWKGSGTNPIWRIPVALLGIKAAAMFALAIPSLAVWFEMAHLRILYLHVLLLGFVSLSILYAAGHTWRPGGILIRTKADDMAGSPVMLSAMERSEMKSKHSAVERSEMTRARRATDASMSKHESAPLGLETEHTFGATVMTIAALSLLVSLVPLSGIWPAAWLSRTVFEVALWISTLPVIAALVLIAEPFIAARRRHVAAAESLHAV